MKKQLLVAVIALITLNDVHAMYTNKMTEQDISEFKAGNLKLQREACVESLAIYKETLENYKELRENLCSFSLKNLVNRLFYNEWHCQQKAQLDKEEYNLHLLQSRKCYNFASHLDTSHRKDLCVSIDTLTDLKKPITKENIAARRKKAKKDLQLIIDKVDRLDKATVFSKFLDKPLVDITKE